MNTTHTDSTAPLTLCKRWVATYNEFLFMALALRQLVRVRSNLGLLREQLRDRAVALTDLADQLRALGYCPDSRFASAEARLWSETVGLVHKLPWQAPPHDISLDRLTEDVARMRDGWERFEAYVAGLPDDFFTHLPALDPRFLREEGVLWLMGQRRQPSASGVGPDHIV
jgi:hypothetical protein